MSDNGFPSMTALLGLLAVAGFQNRDKLASMFGGAGQAGADPRSMGQGHAGSGNIATGNMGTGNMGSAGLDYGSSGGAMGQRASSGLDGLLGGGGAEGSGLGGLAAGLGAGGIGGLLSNGLSELMERFKQAGQGETADSWVRQGPNQQVAPTDLERALGPEVLENLTHKTGLTREELLERLSRQLPDAVDQYTPDGRIGSPT